MWISINILILNLQVKQNTYIYISSYLKEKIDYIKKKKKKDTHPFYIDVKVR